MILNLRDLAAVTLAAVMVLFLAGAAEAQDAAKGEKLFQSRCKVCHAIEAGKASGMGPNLFGVAGRTSGTQDGYAFSAAMKSAAVTWSAETLDPYLTAPGKFIPGGRMAASVPNAVQRADIIAYLMTLGANAK